MKAQTLFPVLALAVVSCVALAVAQQSTESPASPKAESEPRGLGFTKSEAIEACGPKGERAYLDRLRCPEGRPARFEREGSVGFRNEVVTPEDEQAAQGQMMGAEPIKPGAKDFHMLDAYAIRCSGKTYKLYLDMYHCDAPEPKNAPPGFTLGKKGSGGRS